MSKDGESKVSQQPHHEQHRSESAKHTEHHAPPGRDATHDKSPTAAQQRDGTQRNQQVGGVNATTDTRDDANPGREVYAKRGMAVPDPDEDRASRPPGIRTDAEARAHQDKIDAAYAAKADRERGEGNLTDPNRALNEYMRSAEAARTKQFEQLAVVRGILVLLQAQAARREGDRITPEQITEVIGKLDQIVSPDTSQGSGPNQSPIGGQGLPVPSPQPDRQGAYGEPGPYSGGMAAAPGVPTEPTDPALVRPGMAGAPPASVQAAQARVAPFDGPAPGKPTPRP